MPGDSSNVAAEFLVRKKNVTCCGARQGYAVVEGFVILLCNGNDDETLIDWGRTEAEADKKVAAIHEANEAKTCVCPKAKKKRSKKK